VPITLAKVAGMSMKRVLSAGPASTRSTRFPAVTSRFASAQPAEPAPAMM
jgi:hypothetical protein